MVNKKDILGLKVVGYRYGAAPESGKSYNFRDHFFEPGVSMAQVCYCKPIGSFAASGSKKYYYEGVVSGIGSDGEICISGVNRITYQEYVKARKNLIEESNAITNYNADKSIDLIERGYYIGRTIEEVEKQRSEYLK